MLAKKIIITIGGGEIENNETFKIDKEIIKLTGKKNPKLLFIPTASSDSEAYYNIVKKYFSKKFKCKMDVLYLLKDKYSLKEIQNKILNTDIIYVGGGNSLKMLRRWRFLGVDKILKKAWKKGVILCGISAGSICWFRSGHSDSMSSYNVKNWKYINVTGLNFIKGINCPHYNQEKLGKYRKKDFAKMINKTNKMGIAIENNCAIIFSDDKYKVISSDKKSKAFKVYKKNNKIIEKEIIKENKYNPIKNLYLKK